MRRREWIAAGLAAAWTASCSEGTAPEKPSPWAAAAEPLERAVASGQVTAANLTVWRGEERFERGFGTPSAPDTVFLIASITKPMTATGLMVLADRGELKLDDPAVKFLPEFSEGDRQRITIRHLLTHTSGLPDQLPENDELRRAHAPLSEFVARAMKTPLLFEPGTQYKYQSMGILLAAEIAQRIAKEPFAAFLQREVFEPLGMSRTSLDLVGRRIEDTARCQVESAAPESGAGDPTAADWDWNSPYWRNLGAPWGGAHSTGPDIARFLDSFLHPAGKALKPETARMMLENHNAGVVETPRGIGFALGERANSPGCSEKTFGHGGATGTLAWADPETHTICVVLTTLPGGAAKPHPREEAAALVAQAMRA